MNNYLMLFNRAVVLAVMLLFPLAGFAQVELSGTVQSEAGAVAFANVVLKDSTNAIKDGTTTTDQGTFLLSTSAGKYTVVISYIGYKPWSKEIILEGNTSLGEVFLEIDQLEEVVVKASRPLVEYQADRIVFNVENNVAATGGDAMSALKVAPGVIVQNNNISMLGKGSSRFMINGRMIELTGDELVNYLASISSSDIKNIEIISNPPARYQASGNGGLININLKKGAANAWKNTTTVAYNQNWYNYVTVRNSLLYNKNKFRLSASVGGDLGNNRNKADLDILFQDRPWVINGLEKEAKNSFSGQIAADYDISDNTSVGMQYLGSVAAPDRDYLNRISFFDDTRRVNSLLVNDGFNDVLNRNHSYNAHVVSKLDTLGRQISADFDYFNYNSRINNTFDATSYTSGMELGGLEQSASNISNQGITNYSVKADVEHPFKAINLSYGGRVSFLTSKSAVELYDLLPETPVLDPGQSNAFDYRENNQALYVSGSRKFKDKLNVQLGLRLEGTQTEGYSRTLDQRTINNYVKLFPTLYVSYDVHENHKLLFDYGKRINRPNFANLNPFRVYLNSNSFSEGNPFLQPSFSDNFDFTYTFKDKLRTNLFYNHTTNGFGIVFTPDTENNTQVITRQNYFDEAYFGIGESYQHDFTSWWQNRSMIYLLGSKTRFTQNINSSPTNSQQLYLSTNNTFLLGESTKLQVDYAYSSAYRRGLYKFGYTSGLNIGVSHTLLDKSLSIALYVNDVFNAAYLRDYESVVNGVRQIYNENNSSRFFRVSLTYNFGNDKIKVNQRDFGNGEERRRSGN